MKFLIDECLSPELAMDARSRGFFESVHVTWLGLGSKADWAIVQRAIEDGYVLVTNNTTDFKRLVGREAIHPGLVCLNVAHEVMGLAVQKRLFSLALDHLAQDDPIDEVLEITMTRDRSVRVNRSTLSAL
ncbi:MAG: DUF5615 family PIN-like protein [Deltaproteobacteria bacterium]|nr:DUF5615 family PIN-like protein [Deltaproteobacteria bacterium]